MRSFIFFVCGVLILGFISTVFRVSMAESSNAIFVPENYDTIQEAINNAVDGQIIHIGSGIYHEYIIVNKSVSVQGEDPANTIIEGNGTCVLIRITSSNVTLSGFWMKNAETAISLENVSNCKVSGNKITDIKFDVYAGKSSGSAIYFDKCKNSMVEENFFSDIYYTHVFLEGSNHNILRNNFFLANSRWSQPILLRYSNKNIIEWNKVYGTEETNEGGIGITYSTGNIIQFNDIKQNDWCGISLHSSNDTIIRGNNITDHEILFGLYLKRTINTTVYWNNFVGNTGDVGFDNAKNTTWTFLEMGNYWDKYESIDENQDGIGDSPYKFSNQNDTCPLMGKYHPFKVLWDGQPKVLAIISNSTVWLNSTTYHEKEVVIKSRGQQGDYAFCLLQIPEKLCNIKVYVNEGEPISSKYWHNQDFTLVYVLYVHETANDIIIVIPELGLPAFLVTLLIITALVILQKTSVSRRDLSKLSK